MGAVLNNDMPNPDSFTRRAHDQVGVSADRQSCTASLSLKSRAIIHVPSAELQVADSWYACPATGILGLPALEHKVPHVNRSISSRVWLKPAHAEGQARHILRSEF